MSGCWHGIYQLALHSLNNVRGQRSPLGWDPTQPGSCWVLKESCGSCSIRQGALLPCALGTLPQQAGRDRGMLASRTATRHVYEGSAKLPSAGRTLSGQQKNLGAWGALVAVEFMHPEHSWAGKRCFLGCQFGMQVEYKQRSPMVHLIHSIFFLL